jgi:hypothetical protein
MLQSASAADPRPALEDQQPWMCVPQTLRLHRPFIEQHIEGCRALLLHYYFHRVGDLSRSHRWVRTIRGSARACTRRTFSMHLAGYPEFVPDLGGSNIDFVRDIATFGFESRHDRVQRTRHMVAVSLQALGDDYVDGGTKLACRRSIRIAARCDWPLLARLSIAAVTLAPPAHRCLISWASTGTCPPPPLSPCSHERRRRTDQRRQLAPRPTSHLRGHRDDDAHAT